jgi:integrase
MPRLRLTSRTVESVKPISARRVEYWDDTLPGFGLRVSERGAKSWVVLYRHDARPRRLTIGSYPRLALADARDLARKALREIAEGKDPAAEKKVANRAETFEMLALEFLERHAKPNNRRWKETKRIINRELLPRWRNRKPGEIRRRDVLAVLDEVVARGAPTMANGVLAVIRKMYNWAISRDLIEFNPCTAIAKPCKVRARDRVLSPAEIASFWSGLDWAGISQEVRLALKLQLLTASRIGEALNAEWSDIDWDQSVWTVPAERSKNGLSHRIPLSLPARQVLAELRVLTGQRKWLFPSPSKEKPITTNAANRAIARNLSSIGTAKFTPHDLRRTAASGMAQFGISRLVVAKVLNHAETGVTAIYDRYGYDSEKKKALDLWGQKVLEIVLSERRAAV